MTKKKAITIFLVLVSLFMVIECPDILSLFNNLEYNLEQTEELCSSNNAKSLDDLILEQENLQLQVGVKTESLLESGNKVTPGQTFQHLHFSDPSSYEYDSGSGYDSSDSEYDSGSESVDSRPVDSGSDDVINDLLNERAKMVYHTFLEEQERLLESIELHERLVELGSTRLGLKETITIDKIGLIQVENCLEEMRERYPANIFEETPIDSKPE